MRWRWWYAAVAEAGVVRVVVRVGGGWRGSGDEGVVSVGCRWQDEGGAVVGTRWVMRGRWWVGGVEAAGMVMMAVGDGVRCGGFDGGCGVAVAVGWLGWCEGGVEVAAVEWGRRGGAWR
ncbi:hypothetical protein Tco_0202315, partial [Tanacetum coccineum]